MKTVVDAITAAALRARRPREAIQFKLGLLQSMRPAKPRLVGRLLTDHWDGWPSAGR